jgi:hypothetical protein
MTESNKQVAFLYTKIAHNTKMLDYGAFMLQQAPTWMLFLVHKIGIQSLYAGTEAA